MEHSAFPLKIWTGGTLIANEEYRVVEKTIYEIKINFKDIGNRGNDG